MQKKHNSFQSIQMPVSKHNSNIIFLSLGGNLGNRVENLQRAEVLVERYIGKVLRASGIYETAAWGLREQPNFLNRVLEVQTRLPAAEIPAQLLRIELELGRKREVEHWGSRTMDVDVLLWNDDIIKQPDLEVPHPRMHLRNFVLVPLCELAPQKTHPILRQPMQQLLANCPDGLWVRPYEEKMDELLTFTNEKSGVSHLPKSGQTRKNNDMEYIITNPEAAKHVALIQINRPKQLNALTWQTISEIVAAMQAFDADDSVRAIVITGNERAFAAGADIKEMANKNAIEMLDIDQFSNWDAIKKVKKPIIAAVSGFALGGGCELAMLCDMIVASESARFGQPEIKIGTMPGAGGTQRLTKTVGKVRAMEMVLTGRFITAQEAFSSGLVNKVVPMEVYLSEAIKLASKVAEMSPIATKLAKESVLQAFETSLNEGLMFERKNFYLTFASEDRKEGMAAFAEKRKADFRGK